MYAIRSYYGFFPRLALLFNLGLGLFTRAAFLFDRLLNFGPGARFCFLPGLCERLLARLV